METNEKVLRFLNKLKTVGSFYFSSIEIDTYEKVDGDYVDGEDLEIELDELLSELNKK